MRVSGPTLSSVQAQRIHARAADSTDGGLETDGAAQCRRDPHRPAGIGTKRRRDKSGRHGNTRAAARSTRRVRRLVPRVVRRTVVVVDPDTPERELHRVRLPEKNIPAAERRRTAAPSTSATLRANR